MRSMYFALLFGLAPTRLYEDTPHYRPWSYWHHLRQNLCILLRWATFRETAKDCEDELRINSRRSIIHPFRPC